MSDYATDRYGHFADLTLAERKRAAALANIQRCREALEAGVQRRREVEAREAAARDARRGRVRNHGEGVKQAQR